MDLLNAMYQVREKKISVAEAAEKIAGKQKRRSVTEKMTERNGTSAKKVLGDEVMQKPCNHASIHPSMHAPIPLSVRPSIHAFVHCFIDV